MKLIKVLKKDANEIKDPIAFLEESGYVKAAPNIYDKDKPPYQVQVVLSNNKWTASVSIAEKGVASVLINGMAKLRPSEAVMSMKEKAAKKLTSYINSIWAL